VAGEPGWDIRFAQAQECLAETADEAVADARAGRARRLDPVGSSVRRRLHT
jgi:hypothetical protein